MQRIRDLLLYVQNIIKIIRRTARNCSKVSVTRVARLLFLVQPINFLICGVGVDVVEAEARYWRCLIELIINLE